MSSLRILNLERLLRLCYGPQISVGWCIFDRRHIVVFSGRQPLVTGAPDEIAANLLYWT